MKDCVQAFLNKLGYEVNNNAMQVIEECDNWYSNRVIDDFHKRKGLNGNEYEISRLNFAKRCCSDDANLCEIISVTPEKESGSQQFIDDLFNENRFDVRYREQLEKTSATGTVGAYLYLKNANYIQDSKGVVSVSGGEVRINYVDADQILPLTIENKLVTECAFAGTSKVRGKDKTVLTVFTYDDQGIYTAETVAFDENNKEIPEEHIILRLGDVKPFAIMENAEVNNLDNMEGYGLPKIYNNIPYFKALDLCYSLMFGDLDKGEKLVFLNELLATVQKKADGSYDLTPKQKELFILLGEKLPDQNSLIHEYNPEIRIEEITKAFELVLSLISMGFGYGTKKYSFENGQIKTATEYIGERQDEMQELNKQRKQAEDYIEDIIHAAMWFSNQFLGTHFNVKEELSIEFDDSYVEDKATKLETMRNDALSFPEVPELKKWYIMERYNLSEDEADEYIQTETPDEEETED